MSESWVRFVDIKSVKNDGYQHPGLDLSISGLLKMTRYESLGLNLSIPRLLKMTTMSPGLDLPISSLLKMTYYESPGLDLIPCRFERIGNVLDLPDN